MKRIKLFHGKKQKYETRLAQEGIHWGLYTEQALKRGIPTWVDLRNATPLQGFAHIFGDPITEHLLRGEYKEKLIRAATTKPGCILDLGCGAGWLSLELARGGMEVHGIDISLGQIQIARRYLSLVQKKEQFRISYEVGDLNSLTLEPDKYVAIVSWDALHHVQNLDGLFKEMKKALAGDGTIVVFEHIGGPLEIVRDVGGRLFRKPRSPFEDIGANRLPRMFHQHFNVRREQRVLPIACFLAQVFKVYQLPIGKVPICRAIKAIDRVLLKSHLFPGEYIFLEATKA